jgi:DNA invertase Pin-like site-specific DNA recombinase
MSTATLPAAVLYAAKSTEDRHGSIGTQLADCRALAEREGWAVVGEYSDEGFSAYHGNRGDGLARAKAAAVANAPCLLVVQDLDRLARGAGDAPDAADHLGELFFAMRRQRVTLWSVRTGEVDSLRAVMEGERSHSESERKAQATTAGIQRRKDRGAPVGAVPFGYAVERSVVAGQVIASRVVEPERAAVVEEVFAAVATGASPGDVARTLNQRGIATQRGGPWSQRGVRRLVRNDAYRGEEGYPRLVDAELWERANKALGRLDPAAVQRRKGGRRPAASYVLRGLAFCSCGAPMYCITGRYGAHDARHYVCRHKFESDGLCDARPVPADNAELAVLSHLQAFVGDVEPWLAERVAERGQEQAHLATAVTRERAALADAERKVARAQATYDEALDEPEMAAAALRQVARLEAARDAQGRALADAEARAEEWTGAADIDAALDFANRLVRLFGDLAPAAALPELGADVAQALHEALTGITLYWRDAGCLCADFRLRVDGAGEPDRRGTSTAPFSAVPLPPLAVEVA